MRRMKGSIAQIVALTCHANTFLKGKEIDLFFPNNSTCMHCDRIYFVEGSRTSEGKWKLGEDLASTPDGWFNYIRLNNAIGVRVSRIPQNDEDRMNVGFVGQGGLWEMEVLYKNNNSSFWQPIWMIWDQNAPENKIWRVAYGKIGTSPTASIKQKSIDQISKEFLNALKDVKNFAVDIKCDEYFIKNFQKAIDTLEKEKPTFEHDWFHRDLCPKSICDEDIIKILGACQYAYVFGGMGTWNDLFAEEEFDVEEYNRVSENLFSILMETIVVATNVTFYKKSE